EAGHAVQPAEIVAAPADKVPLGVVIDLPTARPQTLNCRPSLSIIDDARYDDFFARQDLRDRGAQPLGRAAELLRERSRIVATSSVQVADVANIQLTIDIRVTPNKAAGRLRTAVVTVSRAIIIREDDGSLASLCLLEDAWLHPVGWPQSVLDRVPRVLSFQV